MTLKTTKQRYQGGVLKLIEAIRSDFIKKASKDEKEKQRNVKGVVHPKIKLNFISFIFRTKQKL